MRAAATTSSTLFFTVVLIWGSTWIAAKFQIGTVPIAWALTYRMALAASLIWIYLIATGNVPRLNRADHAAMCGLGLLMFGANYVTAYEAIARIPSGLVALISSLLVPVNAIALRWFFSQRLNACVLSGAALGFLGLGLVFWHDVASLQWSQFTISGVCLSIISVAFVAAGQMIAVRNGRRGVSTLGATAWGLTYGVVMLALYGLSRGAPIVFDWSPKYLGSLLYLVFVGTIVAFNLYLTLINRIGADRASYVTVLYPIVALLISTVFEGYEWSLLALLGVALVIAGNSLALAGRAAATRTS